MTTGRDRADNEDKLAILSRRAFLVSGLLGAATLGSSEAHGASNPKGPHICLSIMPKKPPKKIEHQIAKQLQHRLRKIVKGCSEAFVVQHGPFDDGTIVLELDVAKSGIVKLFKVGTTTLPGQLKSCIAKKSSHFEIAKQKDMDKDHLVMEVKLAVKCPKAPSQPSTPPADGSEEPSPAPTGAPTGQDVVSPDQPAPPSSDVVTPSDAVGTPSGGETK